jgi:hypothetical protein
MNMNMICSIIQSKEKYNNFDFHIYTSSEEKKYNKGYVTDFLNKEIIKNYEEFYIC